MSRKRHKRKKPLSIDKPIVYIEYYQRPINYLLSEMNRKSDFSIHTYHAIRENYWILPIPKIYQAKESIPLIKNYIAIVEQELATIISKNSIAYWLHLIRRVLPRSVCENDAPTTIGWIRAILEAAIQKYGRFEFCERIGKSSLVPINKVLSGLLMSEEYSMEREIVQNNDQLVLVDFSTKELVEFFNLQKLAYEIWRSTAQLRIIGKGALIEISGRSPHFIFDIRSDNLDKLISNYDKRIGKVGQYFSSFAGVATDSFIDKEILLTPVYNVRNSNISHFSTLFEKLLGKRIPGDFTPNFLFFFINIKEWWKNHRTFSPPFFKKHNVKLEAVILVITSILLLSERISKLYPDYFFSRFFQRAYFGPDSKTILYENINFFLNSARDLLELTEEEISYAEIVIAIDFFELKENSRNEIDLEFPGPHYLFLKIDEVNFITDMAWIQRRLENIFIGVDLSSVNQNFKGDLFENYVRSSRSVLPGHKLKAYDGSSKQIDAAFELNKKLIIVECKSFNYSLDFIRGNPISIKHRNKIITDALEQADDKARWLCNNYKGKNYDISCYKEIIPIVITPFVEYIPSVDHFYWISEDIPRVLSINEFKELVSMNTFINIKRNIHVINNL